MDCEKNQNVKILGATTTAPKNFIAKLLNQIVPSAQATALGYCYFVGITLGALGIILAIVKLSTSKSYNPSSSKGNPLVVAMIGNILLAGCSIGSVLGNMNSNSRYQE